MNPLKRQRIRRACLVVALLAAAWAPSVILTGGFILEAGPLRLSSRNPRNPLMLMALSGALLWFLTDKGHRRRQILADGRWLVALITPKVPDQVRRWLSPRAVAAAMAVTTALTGVIGGAHVAGGSDSYGYISQAHLWATGELMVPQPLLDDLPPGIPPEALIPLAYRFNVHRTALVPTYAPGFPMLMSLFERAGGRDAVFLVMPLLAGVAVFATYALGRLVLAPFGAVAAALFLAIKPSFVMQLVSAPMSDIAATAWWTSALYLAWVPGLWPAFAAGLATGAAILTRPNLVPLAAVVGSVVLVGWWRSAPPERRHASRRVILFAAPTAAACGAVAALNAYWYGSPLTSGYGALAGGLFRWEYFWIDLPAYLRWTFETIGPVSLLSVVGVLALGRSADRRLAVTALIGFALITYACYAFYLPLGTWWSLRLLLPAYPILFILIVAGAEWIAGRMPRVVRPFVMIALVLSGAVHMVTFIRAQGFMNNEGERRFGHVGRFVDAHTPRDAAILSMLHSGSIRHYSGRLTVRYDWIPPDRFAAMIAHLRDRGYSPYLLVDDGELADFNRLLSHVPMDRTEVPMDVPGVTLYRLSAGGEAANEDAASRAAAAKASVDVPRSERLH